MRGCDEEKRSAWRERFERFGTLEMTVQRFCELEGVSVPTFYYWKKRVEEESCEESAFKTVLVAPPSHAVLESSSVTIRFVNGTQLDVPASRSDLVLSIVRQLGDV